MYRTLEEIILASQKDVVCGASVYRVRRISPAEWFAITGVVPLLPDGTGRSPEDEAFAQVKMAYATVVMGLVEPKLASADQVHLMEPEDVFLLAKAIWDLSGLTRPFDGSSTATNCSPSTGSPSDTGLAQAS